jgi:hypothetical protein
MGGSFMQAQRLLQQKYGVLVIGEVELALYFCF